MIDLLPPKSNWPTVAVLAVFALVAVGAPTATLSQAPATAQDAGAPRRPTRVLILFDDAAQSPAVALIAQAVHRRMEADTSRGVELFEEHILTQPGKGAASGLTNEYLKQKYEARAPDLVIGAGLPHAVVVQLTAGEIIGNVPVVLLSSDVDELATAFKSGRVTGVAIRPDAAGTLEAVVGLQPATKHLLVVIGTSDFERALERDIRQQLRPYETRVRIEYTSTKRFPDVLSQVASLGRGSSVLFVTMMQDAAGNRTIPVVALEQLVRASKVSTYGIATTHLGRGIVGGSLLDFAVLGERAAAMAHAVLAGSPPSAIPIDVRPTAAYRFDWMVLRRFGLNPAHVPPGSRFIDRVVSPWEQYRLPLLIMLVVIAAETTLIVALLRQFRRRQVAEQARDAYRKLELLLLRLSAQVVAATAAQVDAIAAEVLAQTSEFVGVDRAMLAMVDESGTSLRVLHSWSAVGVPGVARPMGPAELPATWERLRHGEPVLISSLRSMPDDLVADRDHFNELGVKSAVGLPMMSAGRCVGILTLASVHRERTWDPGLVDGLNLLCLVLTSRIVRRRAELEVTQRREELSHLGRVGIAGELSASLAHEINQPLGAIYLSVQAAQRYLAGTAAGCGGRPDTEEVAHILEEVSDDVRRTNAIIDRLRRLIRKEATDLVAIRMDEIVGGIIALLNGDATRRHIALTHTAHDEAPPVLGDRVQIEQVVVNLVLNAFDSIVATNASKRQVRVSTECVPGGGVLVAVDDSGDGIAPDRLDSIFDPFVTSKREGLGMGLAISRMIIESHGGRMWAENLPGGGARVAFVIGGEPAAPEAQHHDGRRTLSDDPSLEPSIRSHVAI